MNPVYHVTPQLPNDMGDPRVVRLSLFGFHFCSHSFLAGYLPDHAFVSLQHLWPRSKSVSSGQQAASSPRFTLPAVGASLCFVFNNWNNLSEKVLMRHQCQKEKCVNFSKHALKDGTGPGQDVSFVELTDEKTTFSEHALDASVRKLEERDLCVCERKNVVWGQKIVNHWCNWMIQLLSMLTADLAHCTNNGLHCL